MASAATRSDSCGGGAQRADATLAAATRRVTRQQADRPPGSGARASSLWGTRGRAGKEGAAGRRGEDKKPGPPGAGRAPECGKLLLLDRGGAFLLGRRDLVGDRRRLVLHRAGAVEGPLVVL